MRPEPYTWIFTVNYLQTKNYLYKARFCVRGDKKEALINFHPSNIYAPVAANERIRLLLSYPASKVLIL